MSLVSLVVLGIFGRNTGFGPSMSLNNIIDHKRDVYVQKKRNVFAWNFHKMYENQCFLFSFAPPWFWGHGETGGWGVEGTNVLVSVTRRLLGVTFKKRHIRWLQSLPYLLLQLPLVCHLCLRWLVGAGEYFISEDIFVQIYQYFGNIGEIV